MKAESCRHSQLFDKTNGNRSNNMMGPTRTYVGPMGEITSFPPALRGVLAEGGRGYGEPDYGALYALPTDERQARRAELDADGYWSHR